MSAATAVRRTRDRQGAGRRWGGGAAPEESD
jgi:hypothetical protein